MDKAKEAEVNVSNNFYNFIIQILLMKHTFLFQILWICLLSGGFSLRVVGQNPFPYDTRSDSISIEHYSIHLDVRDFSNFILKGKTEISLKPLVNNITAIRLDLIGLIVDSVHNEVGTSVPFNTISTGLTIDFTQALNSGDSTALTVFYHGITTSDPSFGGFYFNSSFAYNVGVSLSDIPHNYGKTWFPCFDDFTTRSTFDLHITTLPTHQSVCGGVLISTDTHADLSKTDHWKINQRIPSYLVSVAVSDFKFVNKTFSNYQNDLIPVNLAARHSDTTNMKNSFVNLESAFDIFESKFGPYRWDRVGYVLVPMTAGAMEHAMNIAYPILGANGSLAWESVMAHELSHHWWGNLVTCRTAEDMWINEGSAAYCEYIFTENFNNRNAYEADVRNAHKKLLQTCHMEDDGYWPLSGVPQEHTYGSTTYTKGADMIHTLRGYLGDSLFFSGLKTFLEENKFSDVDALEYRDDLSEITGVDLTNFFNDWIFQGGWPHLSIDSFKVAPNGGQYQTTVYLKQKLVGRTQFGNQIPVTLTLRDNDWNTFEQRIYSTGEHNSVTITVPFAPSLAYLNRDELISHAVTSTYNTFSNTGNQTLGHSNVVLQIQNISDSVFFVAEHHWAAPDAITTPNPSYEISTQRFWRIDGLWNSNFQTNATFRYSGMTTTSFAYLDHLLITGSEDSVVLLYRPNTASNWAEFPTYTKSIGNPNDKTGTFNVTNLLKGEYTIALKGQPLSIGEKVQESKIVNIYPNPSSGKITIESTELVDKIVITDPIGRFIEQKHLPDQKSEFNTSTWKKGSYWITGYRENVPVYSEQIQIQ